MEWPGESENETSYIDTLIADREAARRRAADRAVAARKQRAADRADGNTPPHKAARPPAPIPKPKQDRSPLRLPNIVLVGGPITMSNGEEWDTRKQVAAADLVSVTTYLSPSWWHVVSDLADAIDSDCEVSVLGPAAPAVVAGASGLGARWTTARVDETGAILTGGGCPSLGVGLWVDAQSPVFPADNPDLLRRIEGSLSQFHGGTVVVPDTMLARQAIDALKVWVLAGRPPSPETRQSPPVYDWQFPQRRRVGYQSGWRIVPPPRLPDAPLWGDFQITALLREGDWEDPRHAEVVRACLAQSGSPSPVPFWRLVDDEQMQVLSQPAIRSSPPITAPVLAREPMGAGEKTLMEKLASHGWIRQTWAYQERPCLILLEAIEKSESYAEVDQPGAWISVVITNTGVELNLEASFQLVVNGRLGPHLERRWAKITETSPADLPWCQDRQFLVWQRPHDRRDEVDLDKLVNELVASVERMQQPLLAAVNASERSLRSWWRLSTMERHRRRQRAQPGQW